MKKIAVIMGGPSSEHDISLRSGENVVHALDPEKYQAIPVIITREEIWLIDNKTAEHEKQWKADIFLQSEPQKFTALDAMQEFFRIGVQVAFLATHGKYGEDGKLQHFLEVSGISYTGSNGHASAIAMHKGAAKTLCGSMGIPVIQDVKILIQDWKIKKEEILHYIKKMAEKIVIKGIGSGSSLDMAILSSHDEKLESTLNQLLNYTDVIVEQFIVGIEVTCGVLEKIDRTNLIIEPLAVTEIRPKIDGFFSYQAKYNAEFCEELTPAPLPSKVIKNVQEYAVRCHQILGCNGYSRSDFIINYSGDRNNFEALEKAEIVYLETNTLPGLTLTSLLPQGAMARGINFSALLDRIIENRNEIKS